MYRIRPFYSVYSSWCVSRSCVRFIQFQVVINCAGQAVLIEMEKLGPKEQEGIQKFSDVRLVANLTKASLNQNELEVMDRPTMLNEWAKLVVAGASKKCGVASVISPT